MVMLLILSDALYVFQIAISVQKKSPLSTSQGNPKHQTLNSSL